MKKIVPLLMITLSFAGWQEIAVAALVTSGIFLAILYAIGAAFSLRELIITSKEELYQLIATALLIALLIGSDGLLNNISTNADLLKEGERNIQEAAMRITEEYAAELETILNVIRNQDIQAASEGGRSFSCYSNSAAWSSFSPCGGLSAYSPAFSTAGNIVGTALGVVVSMNNLLRLSVIFAYNVILPAGILLRAFKVTRGAGGILIAFAIGLYVILPLSIIFGNEIVKTYQEQTTRDEYKGGEIESIEIECPSSAAEIISLIESIIEGRGSFASEKVEDLKVQLRRSVPTVLFKGILVPAVALLSFAGSIRALASLGGAEINVSAIARFI